ncbi:MAG: MFS transporter [Pseudomonadota bacterium]
MAEDVAAPPAPTVEGGNGAPPPVPETGEASFRAKAGWALFDWAYQPFFALSAFVFAPYFAATLVGDPVRGQTLWGTMLGLSGIAVAIFSPVFGAIADAAGRQKPWVLVFSVVTAIASAALWFAGAGASVTTVLIVFGVATAAAEFAAVFNNAMLPGLVPKSKIGSLSGIGWGLGYAGGLVALVFVLLALVLPETPLFGIDPSEHEAERLVGPISSVWLALFLVPFFVYTPDRAGGGVSPLTAAREGVARLAATLAKARALKNAGRFLLARMLYQDGLTALLSFAGLYGAGVFGWSTTTLGLFAIILILAAVPGSFAGGFLDDRIGAKPTVLLAVGGLTVGAAGALTVEPDRLFFMFPVDTPPEGAAPFSGTAERVFLGFGLLMGLCVGPAQASSRSLMARIAPPGMISEFYGLFAFSGKATTFAAPLLIAAATSATGTQSIGLMVVIAFLVAGFLLFLGVREEQAVLTER